jgi:hypothetical protein
MPNEHYINNSRCHPITKIRNTIDIDRNILEHLACCKMYETSVHKHKIAINKYFPGSVESVLRGWCKDRCNMNLYMSS